MASSDYELSFPAIRGVQAGKEYYVAMCPLNVAVDIIKLNDEDETVPAELRAQRALNKSRVPALRDYVLKNPDSYAFSSLTVSIDSRVDFVASGNEGIAKKMGTLKVPYGVTYLINDGQHRRAAIEQALREKPELRHETISLVIYIDQGLKRAQQLFADLNRYVVRPTSSLGILYDHRDPMARLMQGVVADVEAFKLLTEKAKTTISNRSRKLFTLSVLYQATCDLLGKKKGDKVTDKDRQLASAFWSEVVQNIPDWQQAAKRQVLTSELRKDCVHAHGIALRSLGRVGTSLVLEPQADWKKRLKKLRDVDWSRTNTALWEGRAMVAAKISKSHNNIVLTGNVIKQALGMELSPAEQQVETDFKKRDQPNGS